MSDLLTGVIVALFFALLSLRPPTSDAHTPAQMRDAVRRAGAGRALLGALRITLIVELLLLVEACRLVWQAALALAFLFTVLANGIAALGGGTALTGGRA